MKFIKIISILTIFILIFNINVFANDTKSDLQTLTVEAATKKAIAYSRNLKTMEENKILAENSIYDVHSDLNYATEHVQITNLAVELKNLYYQISNYEANQEIEKESIELSVIQFFTAILDAEKNIELYDKNLDIKNKELEILRIKVDLGLISQSDYDKQLNEYNSVISQRDSLEIAINDAYTALNKILGTSLDKRYKLELDIQYEPLGDVSLDTQIAKAISGSQKVKEKEKDIEIAKYELESYSSLYSTERKESKENAYAQATRALSDTKIEIQEGVTNVYNQIKTIETEYENNLITLEQKKKELKLKELQLEVGKITELELESYKYEIESLEAAIQNQIYSHDVLVRKFNNYNLI